MTCFSPFPPSPLQTRVFYASIVSRHFLRSPLPYQSSGTEPLNLLSVQVYNGETLSVLLEYRSSERDDVMFNAVAQLPVKPVLNLANEAFGELALEGYVFL